MFEKTMTRNFLPTELEFQTPQFPEEHVMFRSPSHRRSALVVAQLLFSVLLLASNAWADTQAVSIVLGNVLNGAAGYTYGWSFTPAVDIDVTALEVFDFNNFNQQIQTLNEAHPVAIWSTTNTSVPLVSAIVPSGTAAPVVGIYFREVPVTPTLLLAGKTYVIGALYDASNTDLTVYDPNATVTYSPLITAGYYQVAANAPNTLAYPGFVSEYRGLYGPNFAFEAGPPSAWAAAVSGSWSNAGNWTAGVPNAIGAGAAFDVSTATPLTITLDAPQTVGTLLLGNSGARRRGLHPERHGKQHVDLEQFGPWRDDHGGQWHACRQRADRVER